MKVIAEIGSAWSTRQDIVHAVTESKAAGADVVKFQWFSSQCLYGPNYTARSQMPDLSVAAETAAKVGIELMCSAFSPIGVMNVNPYVSAHKVASAEMEHKELISSMLATGKPLYWSTGAHSLKEVETMLRWMDLPIERLTIMYCDSTYPSYVSNPRNIESLKSFGYPVGFSDHSKEIYSTIWISQILGLTCIEKHVDFSVTRDFPDSPHSLGPAEFARFCRYAQGYNPDYVVPEEKEMRDIHNRRQINGGFYRGTTETENLREKLKTSCDEFINAVKLA